MDMCFHTYQKAKKQKIDDDQEEADMRKLIEIVPDDEDVAIDAIPLATKPQIIVDWKIIKEGKMGYFQIIRADGSSKCEVWRNLHGHKVTVWKLFSASRVHFMRVNAADTKLQLLTELQLLKDYKWIKIAYEISIDAIDGWDGTKCGYQGLCLGKMFVYLNKKDDLDK
ncbi:hypothetical protein Tco_1199990 [Tanacetum coccineum]